MAVRSLMALLLVLTASSLSFVYCQTPNFFPNSPPAQDVLGNAAPAGPMSGPAAMAPTATVAAAPTTAATAAPAAPTPPTPTIPPNVTPSPTRAGSPPGPAPGTTKYTQRLGGSGGTPFGPYVCPAGYYADEITLSYQAGKSLAPLTGLEFYCSNDRTQLYIVTRSGLESVGGKQAYQSAETNLPVRGFSTATAFVSDFISGIAFRASDGTSVFLNTSAYLRNNQGVTRTPFNLPSGAQITGFGGNSGDWIDSLYLAYQ